jgi:hypothetical protein
MEPISIVALAAILLIIISIIVVYRRIYILHNNRSNKKDLFVAFGFLFIMLAFFLILPFNSETTNVSEDSYQITKQETITKYFVVSGKDTLLISKICELDTTFTGALPEGLNLKIEKKYTIFGEEIFKKLK